MSKEGAMRMRITISVCGRFHAFNLAQQLLKRGYLRKLITSYPKFEVRKYGIPSEKIDSIVIKEILSRGWAKLPAYIRGKYNPQLFIHGLYDKLASRKVEKTDIFVGWSSACLNSLRRGKQLGAITVVERGSSHMLYQTQILKEEFANLGLTFNQTHPKIIEKELQEYEEAHFICVPSRFAKRTFLERGVAESKLLCINYGVDLNEFRQVPKEDSIFRVIFAGIMSIQKGTHYLLQVFSELKLPNSELLLIGEVRDEMKPFFKRYQGSFKWIGVKPQRELYKYYSQGSVFVMPSIQEGLAMVQVQAMACGLPLICTTNTGGEDLISEGKEGFVIPIRDVEALKEKILFFYEDRDRCKQMGEAAKRKVQQSFTWDDYGQRVVEKYAEILRVCKE
jgi:glycosyltransferase involved in cell wall biosynthesis